MALNNATFNTLRMLLSVAPKELLRSVHFRFGGTNNPQGNQFDEKNEINLKRLGERQTILLLETLKECDDEYDDADNESDDENEDRSILQRIKGTVATAQQTPQSTARRGEICSAAYHRR
uniref:Uncharacterized protein n=1 Tax=Anopheles melas TaxID=34690 RepID=A0A182TXN7_9DIPT